MIHETRVNLRRLLHDIRDAYSSPIEEVIVTELVANALDSGATRIEFFVAPEQRIMRCIDNGKGMARNELKEYHDIAATTKTRGHGIGFAGIGAKLSLLVAEHVITETRGPRGSRNATTWHLTSTSRAPWKFIPSPGHISSPRGTAVELLLSSLHSPLTDECWLTSAIVKHFFPILDTGLRERILRLIYPKGIFFFINGAELHYIDQTDRRYFKITIGKQNTRPVGIGYLIRTDLTQAATSVATHGLSVSTFGKVIKHGWEWLGLMPKLHSVISGIVEIPELSEILTINKSDFLNDTTSLKKYYRLRKAVQEAVLKTLPELGEPIEPIERIVSKEVQTLSREIESVLEALTDDFPELIPLVGTKRKAKVVPAALTDVNGETVREERIEGLERKEHETREEKGSVASEKERLHLEESVSGDLTKTVHKKIPGLKIALQEFAGDEPLVLGRIIEEAIIVNTGHHAWGKAVQGNFYEYHIVLTVACLLSEMLEQGHAPVEFISRFLSSWSQSPQQKMF